MLRTKSDGDQHLLLRCRSWIFTNTASLSAVSTAIASLNAIERGDVETRGAQAVIWLNECVLHRQSAGQVFLSYLLQFLSVSLHSGFPGHAYTPSFPVHLDDRLPTMSAAERVPRAALCISKLT